MWCDACRSTGAIHCAMPDECGNMLSATAAADNWKAWLDDLPLPFTFDPAIGRLQDFITGLTARIEAQAGSRADAAAAQALMVQKAVAPLTDGEAYSAALGYRHDLGLLPPRDQELECSRARWWHVALSHRIRALAPADGLAAVEALRAEIADLKMNMDADLRTMVREGQQLRTLAAELAASRAREAVLVEALETVRDTDSFSAAQRAAFAALTSTALAPTPTDPGDGWTWNERLGWIGPDGKPADPRRRG